MKKITINDMEYEVVPVRAELRMPNGELASYAKSIGKSFPEYAAERNAEAIAKEILKNGSLELGKREYVDHDVFTAKLFVLRKVE